VSRRINPVALKGHYKSYGWQTGYGGFTYSFKDKDHLIEYVKNQEEHHKIVTFRDELIELLNEHGIEFDEMYMRPKDDYRKDTIIKKEIYQNEVVGKYNLLCVYDDRLQVLDMWYDQGVFTFNVNQGNHNF
jgi:hypothetical protein